MFKKMFYSSIKEHLYSHKLKIKINKIINVQISFVHKKVGWGAHWGEWHSIELLFLDYN